MYSLSSFLLTKDNCEPPIQPGVSNLSIHPKGEMGTPLGFVLQTTAKPETRKTETTTRVCMGESVR